MDEETPAFLDYDMMQAEQNQRSVMSTMTRLS